MCFQMKRKIIFVRINEFFVFKMFEFPRKLKLKINRNMQIFKLKKKIIKKKFNLKKNCFLNFVKN